MKKYSSTFLDPKESTLYKTGNHNLSKSFEGVPEDDYNKLGTLKQRDFTPAKVKDSLCKKRGTRINNDRCVLCHKFFKWGWLYHTFEGDDVLICNECKSKYSEGKINFKKQMINCKF